MSRAFWAIAALGFVASSAAHADLDRWLVKQKVKDGQVRVISVQRTELSSPALDSGAGKVVLRSFPTWVDESAAAAPTPAPSREIYEEILYADGALPPGLSRLHSVSRAPWPGSEVRSLAAQGPAQNRINLTMVGDGYLPAEKEKFFADAARITHDLFTGATFASYRPIFNVNAVFVPSKESGLTDGEHKRDTALGLYRNPAGSKRAVYPGNSEAIDAAIALAPATDYPILIANDDFYGGLGGEYAITTRSVESGIVVLRHELGHNFGQVGEEYDAGQVYTGVNTSLSPQAPWSYWADAPLRAVETQFLSGQYVWQNLAGKPFTTTFQFPEGWQFEILLSGVGWATPDDVRVALDGTTMKLEGLFTTDRSFFTFHPDATLAPGRHSLEIRENLHGGEHVLAYAEVYANPADFDGKPDHIGAYATYDDTGRKVGYRPTHFGCLMRNMRTPHFCPVDLENMWTRFLNRVSLIDAVQVTEGASRMVTLSTPDLAGIEPRWFSVAADGKETELADLRGKRSWPADASYHGNYRARVSFRTTEVRRPTPAFDAAKDFSL